MTTFSDLSLDPRVLQAVTESGYTTPTPIQVQAIPHALEGRDVLGIAQTGTGKTAGFVLPMLTHLSKGRARARMPRSLVLAPTRELAAQVAEQFEKYSAHLKLSMALLIGGVSFKDQDKLIDRGVDVLIATPGRLLDHFERGKLMLTGVQIMVVDEADRMLDMGFIPDIERIFKLVPFTRQTLFFSATMAPEITRITQEFLHNPVRVEVARQATTSETIDQFVVRHTPRRKDTSAAEKREVLRRVIRAEGEGLRNGIIFCNRKVDVDIVAKSLKRHGFDAQAMHGDLDQKLRMKILQAFRDGEAQAPDRLRRRRARSRHPQRQPHLQFRRADPLRGLRPPDRPHRPRWPFGTLDHPLPAARGEVPRQDRGAGEQADPADGEPAEVRRRPRARRSARAVCGAQANPARPCQRAA